MRLQVNGQASEFPAGLTAQALLEHMALAGRRVALEVNGEIVPRSGHATHELKDGDTVEIIHAVGGG
ncbi:MAG TPA: sulfur carrier protein ThiS [Gammaproteobacteria bacterium]|nr:sulfur carrier protein ThiS [Gammaproteobacteria bacterium]